MASDLDIRPIIWDFIRPFNYRHGRKFNFSHTFWTALVPIVCGTLFSFLHPTIAEKYQVTFLAAFGLVAAVMTALLPMIQYIVGIDVKEKYSEAQFASWQNQVVRLEILRNLYSGICMSVFGLVFSLVPLGLLQVPGLPIWLNQCVSAIVYILATHQAVVFVQVITGVYAVLDAQAKQLSQKLRDLEPKDRD